MRIDVKHVEAAKAWIDYSTASVLYVFQNHRQQREIESTRESAEKIYLFLRGKGTAGREEIFVECFQKHQSKTVIDKALQFLLAQSPPVIDLTETPRLDGKPGRVAKIYSLVSSLTIGEVSEHSEV